jgi:hypothetical protein
MLGRVFDVVIRRKYVVFLGIMANFRIFVAYFSVPTAPIRELGAVKSLILLHKSIIFCF